ncbi:cytochrome P450 [Streptomyces sp. LX-29]|uniref:cytochrome P450 family protein n=1 Tax=Streptomyces sp. LX-29 TaxID=2900152 RepID=UPI00240D6D69|nr:cytochrome P450 [Streptomyces sp. LX-29]WFB08578.1 cytochrome P450 [Streptomyces sp. LX-29]
MTTLDRPGPVDEPVDGAGAPADGPTAAAAAQAARGAPEFRRDPHSVYARLRESAPVCPMRPPHGVDTYLVTRYEDARTALADPRLSKDMYGAMDVYQRIFGETSVALDDHMLNCDPPKHTRLRKLVTAAFTPRRVEALGPGIQQITDRLLDTCPAHEPVDLLTAFAFPLPVVVICELLGVPESDRRDVQTWSTTIAHTGFSPESKRAGAEAERRLLGYLTELIGDKRDRPGEDLLSALAAVRDEDAEDGRGRLTDHELVSTAFLLVFAGHKSTAYMIGNSVFHLLREPEQLRALRERPELMEHAVEELMRYDGSVESSTFRYAAEELELGGVPIPKGALVQISLTSANRDPRRFTDPDRLDVTRQENIQTGHLALGHGVHYCLGAPLARMELRTALTTLFTRFPELALAVPADEVPWLEVPFPAFRGLAELPVVLAPA